MEFIAIVAKKQNLLLWLQLGVATLIWSEYFLVVMSECPSLLNEKKNRRYFPVQTFSPVNFHLWPRSEEVSCHFCPCCLTSILLHSTISQEIFVS